MQEQNVKKKKKRIIKPGEKRMPGVRKKLNANESII